MDSRGFAKGVHEERIRTWGKLVKWEVVQMPASIQNRGIPLLRPSHEFYRFPVCVASQFR